MLRLKLTAWVVTAGALLIAAACSSSRSDDDNRANQTDGGKGGAASQGGAAGKGRGGSTSRPPPPDAAGDGGSGGEAEECPGCKSGVCLEDGTCVDCLPSKDRCPSGEYCSEDNECHPGCKDTTSCASGICAEDHSCKHCIDDSECSGGTICSAGECTPACGTRQEGTSTGCSDGTICCSERCSNLAIDSKNCGACGNACDTGQFCGLTTCANSGEGGAGGAGADSGSCVQCRDTTLANICSVKKVTVILDSNKNPSDGNRVPARAIGAALRANCLPAPVLAEAEQDSVEALNIKTGQPVSDSSELLVVAGGPFYQNLEGYLENEALMPLYAAFTGDVTEFRRTGTDKVVASLPFAGDHDSHDVFIIQFTRHPVSGSLILNEQGFWLSGTVAGAYQLTHGILPELPQQDKAWYAYEWTDADGDKEPDLNEIELLDSGK